MKTVYSIFIAICILAVSFPMYADTPGTTTGTIGGGGGVKPLDPKIPSPGSRPKMPSLQEVYATYEDGYLTISFKLSEGSAYLYVYGEDDAAPCYTAGFSTITETTLYLGDISNAYLLIETEYGNGYEGWIY